jgi:hypothetical protein
MNGGTISGNTALGQGGGVYITSGTISYDFGHVYGDFTMNGGEISGNRADRGNGVYMENFTSVFKIAGDAHIAVSDTVYLYNYGYDFVPAITLSGSLTGRTGIIAVIDIYNSNSYTTTPYNRYSGYILEMEDGGKIPEELTSRFMLGTYTANSGNTVSISGYRVMPDGRGSWCAPMEIKSFKIGGWDCEVKASSISLSVPYGTDLRGLTPEFTLSPETGISVSPEPGTNVDFREPVTYRLTAPEGTTKTYVVTVTAQGRLPGGITITDNYTPRGDLQLDTEGLVISPRETGYTNPRWYVDNEFKGAGNSLSLAGYAPGSCIVTLIAEKDGVPYSAEVRVRVE